MYKRQLLIASLMFSSACAINGAPEFDYSKVPEEVLANTEKNFLLVPGLLFDGSSARLNESWMITAAHNNLVMPFKLIKHPTCDVALYKSEGTNVVPKGLLYDKVFTVGYPAALPLAVNEGIYLMDFIGTDGCQYSGVSATIIGGMSGGGAYNDRGELVGINIGISDLIMNDGTKYDDISTIMAFPQIEEWIKETIAANP